MALHTFEARTISHIAQGCLVAGSGVPPSTNILFIRAVAGGRPPQVARKRERKAGDFVNRDGNGVIRPVARERKQAITRSNATKFWPSFHRVSLKNKGMM